MWLLSEAKEEKLSIRTNVFILKGATVQSTIQKSYPGNSVYPGPFCEKDKEACVSLKE